ncbi:hypothetical protein [Vibrio penaeicida]|uniref:hypothetical protein n=1 Tax=Vibrio penaeicida TaxID=104609 RepID=UPI000CE9FB92|nr:hypothetical protein [Vibrio penaeicida]
MRFLVLIVFGLFTVNALSDQVLHVSDTCKKEYIEDLHTLNTKDASLYAYYHYIASGGCLDVDLKDEGRFDRINQHFAKLGNYSAYTEVHNDYSQIVDKAKQGDIDARAILITANAVQKTAHYSRSPKLDALNLSDLDKQRYVAEILDLADQGDIRVLKSTLIYYLWTPIRFLGDDVKPAEAVNRLNKADQLVKDFGEHYAWLKVFHNMWLLGAKDFKWCAADMAGKRYQSEFERSFDSFSRPLVCGNTFNKQDFNKIGSMTEVQRLELLKHILETKMYPMPDSKDKQKHWFLDWDKTLNTLGYLTYYETPFSKEALSFLLMDLPYEPKRNLQGFQWLMDENPTKLLRLISSDKGRNIYETDKSFESQGIPSIPSSIKQYARSFAYTDINKYYEITLKNVVPMGDFSSLYVFYLFFTHEDSVDEAKAIAAIEALELIDPSTAASLKKDFAQSGLKYPSRKDIDKVIDEWKPYLPKKGQGKNIRLRFSADIQPYVISELDSMVGELTKVTD